MCVEAVNCCNQVVSWNADLFCQVFQCVSFECTALCYQVICRFVEVVNFVTCWVAVRVHNDEHIRICLCDESLCHFVTTAAFVNKTVTFFVYKDTSFNVVFDVTGQGTCFWVAQWQQLDVTHIDKVSTNFFSHSDTVTSYAGSVSCFDLFAKVCPLCVVFLTHFYVACETACCKNNTVCSFNSNFVACFAFCDNACYNAIFNDKFFSCCFVHYFDAFVAVYVCTVCFEEACTYWFNWFVCTWPHTACNCKYFAFDKFHTHGFQPFYAVPSIFNQDSDKFWFTSFVTAFVCLCVVEFNAVVVCFCDVAAFVNCVQSATSQSCVTTHSRCFFKNQNIFAVFVSCNCCSHTCAACTNNYNVNCQFYVFFFFSCSWFDSFQCFNVSTCLCQTVCNTCQNSV